MVEKPNLFVIPFLRRIWILFPKTANGDFFWFNKGCSEPRFSLSWWSSSLIWFLYFKWYDFYRMSQTIWPENKSILIRFKGFNQFLTLIASLQISVLSFQIAYSALNFLLLNRHLRQFDSFNNFYSDLESEV